MKYITITVGKSQNPNTGEHWWKADATVSVGENEVPEDVFKRVRADIDSWLPNQFARDPFPKPITIEQVPDVQIGKDPIAGHITAINSASNLAALNWHRALVEKEGDKHPELRLVFDRKLQELNNK